MTPATEYFDMNAAPLRIGVVRLKVRDLEAVSAFYRTVLGLAPIETGGSQITLGAGATPLLELRGDDTLTPRDPRLAGLFHTAFLLPTRADLAQWVRHAAEARAPLQGASDHIVSEAIYLDDPEGNGIEVYADRPVSRWRGPTGEIRMSTDPLDVQDLLDSAEGDWSGFPEDGMVGHVHLQVGDTEVADRFYRDVLGLDIAARYPGASFYGGGGYHHQLAGNVWKSRGAGPLPDGRTGLDQIEIVLRDDETLKSVISRAETAGIAVSHGDGAAALRDPWGAAIALRI